MSNFITKIFKQIKRYKNNVKIIGSPIKKQKTIFEGKGEIKFGENVHLGYYPSPFFNSTYCYLEARHEISKIEIGTNTYINNNASIISNGELIKIGENCRIGTNFQCYDSDFHGILPENRDNPEYTINKHIFIGDNVFIGNNVIILKGVNLGNNCVVGAGSVVTKSFKDNSIIAGNPAKLIKKIEEYND